MVMMCSSFYVIWYTWSCISSVSFYLLPAGSDSSEINKDEVERTYGMGGAMGMISSSSMGMLSSLTTVVQSTVRAS